MTCRVRTSFSFRFAAGLPEEVVSRLVEIGATHAPLTDRGSLYATAKWGKLCRKAKLRPVFGIELAVSPDIAALKLATDFCTFLAKRSLQPIHDLLGTATNQFRYTPLLTCEQMQDAQDVTTVVGYRSDPGRLRARSDLFVAAAPSATPAYLRAVVRRGLPPIAASDNAYPRREDHGFYQVAVGHKASTQTYPQHLLSDVEWRDAMQARGHDPGMFDDALAARDAVLAAATATAQSGSSVVPDKPVPLRALCEQGAARLGIDLSEPSYAARLQRELDLIEDKQFGDYFHTVADLMQWARRSMTVGPGRGSSGGSLACFLLGITTIDPIEHDLVFERFIDISRGGWRFPKGWAGFPGAPISEVLL